MSDLIIRKAHPIIEAGYKLTIAEQRIILLSLAELDNRDITQSKVTLYAKDYAEKFGIDEKLAYRDIQNASKRLYDRSIILKGEDETTEFRWIESRTKYYKGEGRVSFEFSRRVLPYLFELDKKLGYTQYHLLSVSGFTSTYSIRLYELCKKIKGMINTAVEVEELRRILQVEDKYSEFKFFKRDILNPSIDEINAKSDINANFNVVKRGRKIVAIDFIIEDKRKTTKQTENKDKKPKLPSKSSFGKYTKLDRQNPAMSSAEYADYAKACLIEMDKCFNDISEVPDKYLRNYWVFLACNASHKSKLGNKQIFLDEIRKRGYKLVECELFEIDKKQIDFVDYEH